MRSLLKNWVLPALVATVIIFGALALSSVVLFTRNDCSDDLIREELSPDGKHAAAWFERNCGATAPYVYHVNVRHSSHKFSRNWSGTTTDGEVFTVPRELVRADWTSNAELVVTSKHRGALQSEWNGIRISYSDGNR